MAVLLGRFRILRIFQQLAVVAVVSASVAEGKENTESRGQMREQQDTPVRFRLLLPLTAPSLFGLRWSRLSE